MSGASARIGKSSIPLVLGKAAALSLASNIAVLFVLKFGLFLWPDRLPSNSQNIFWLASGVNVAGLLIFGWRYWPVLLLNAFPAWLFAGEPLDVTLLASTTNTIEALAATLIILKLGNFRGTFDGVRPVVALLVASVLAPLVNTLIIPAYFCAKGVIPWSEYDSAIGTWNLANGAAMLFLAPLLLSLRAQQWSVAGKVKEFIVLAIIAIASCAYAFHAVFVGAATNFAFIVFPVVIYAAVRFGQVETSVTLLAILLSIYGSLMTHAGSMSPALTSTVIWFVQAFCWVLAATGLLVAALAAERRRAENLSLELSLRAERARLDALRYQINPHFLFNALNSVRASLPLSEGVAREMITDLSDYLRSALTQEDTDRMPLLHEVRSAEDYLAIERHRFGERLQVSVDVPADAGQKMVPVLLVQPLVENAIRHGLEVSWDPCRIGIVARLEEQRLQIEVSNTGKWRDPGEHKGVGLENIRRRLQLLYQSRAKLSVAHSDGLVRLQIEIPA